jgi:hypothetical protein
VVLQILDRGPVDEDVDEFGLEGVAQIEGLGLVGTGSRPGGTVGEGREPAGLVAAIHVWTLWRETPGARRRR